jgi:hypothetical protein
MGIGAMAGNKVTRTTTYVGSAFLLLLCAFLDNFRIQDATILRQDPRLCPANREVTFIPLIQDQFTDTEDSEDSEDTSYDGNDLLPQCGSSPGN